MLDFLGSLPDVLSGSWVSSKLLYNILYYVNMQRVTNDLNGKSTSHLSEVYLKLSEILQFHDYQHPLLSVLPLNQIMISK